MVSHARRVAKLGDKNKMNPGNLGVVFGPTLMRPEVETNGYLMNLNHQNSVGEYRLSSDDGLIR